MSISRKMELLAVTCVYLSLLSTVYCSTLTAPPLSAVIVAFEDTYELSLVANSLSDQGIDTSLIVPSYRSRDMYENLIEVDIIQLNVDIAKSADLISQALQQCENLLKNEEILKKLQELQPTFAIFPALRHDACLIPWANSLGAIPVIWVRNSEEELYTFHCANVAIPIHIGGFWSRLMKSLAWRSMSLTIESEYTTPALRLVTKLLPNINFDHNNLYSNVNLIFWGADRVLRTSFASLSHLLVEVGCHHCRGAHPLPADIHKRVIEYRLGTISVLLDNNYERTIGNLANELPQGRQGQAVVWKTTLAINPDKSWPENVFVNESIHRQDLIGYSRTRVLLSHCTDTELLEAAFHGTPVICFPRNTQETENAARAVELGFAAAVDDVRDLTNAASLAKLINTVHESVEYRENARKVSLAIRDRPDPAVDRLIFWLRYVARMQDRNENFLAAKREVRTLVEDSQLFSGVIVGCIIGIASAAICFFARHSFRTNQTRFSKRKYSR